MAVSKRLRFEIFRRDDHTCRYCGAGPPGVKLAVDHVVPEALGGKTEAANLVTSCEQCNSGKASSTPGAPLVEQVADDALRWAKAYELAAEVHRFERWERDQFRDSFLEAWQRWTYEHNGQRRTFDMPLDWPDSIDSMQQAGLDEEDLADAIDTAMRRRAVNDHFRYFCGVAWRMVGARQAQARQILVSKGPERSATTGLALEPHIAAALDHAGAQLEPWVYDEFVLNLAARLRGDI